MASQAARKTKRVLGVIPIAIGLAVLTAAAIFAWTHMAAKKTAPQQDLTSEEVLEGDVPPLREPYGLEDFTEPDRK